MLTIRAAWGEGLSGAGARPPRAPRAVYFHDLRYDQLPLACRNRETPLHPLDGHYPSRCGRPSPKPASFSGDKLDAYGRDGSRLRCRRWTHDVRSVEMIGFASAAIGSQAVAWRSRVRLRQTRRRGCCSAIFRRRTQEGSDLGIHDGGASFRLDNLVAADRRTARHPGRRADRLDIEPSPAKCRAFRLGSGEIVTCTYMTRSSRLCRREAKIAIAGRRRSCSSPAWPRNRDS